MNQLIYFCFCHWIGDYAFQTGEMAEGKSRSLYWLSIHVLAYTSALILGSIVLYFVMYGDYTVLQLAKFVGTNAILHWITDFITSKLARYFKTRNTTLYYWTLGIDQFIHVAIMSKSYEKFLI